MFLRIFASKLTAYPQKDAQPAAEVTLGGL
jgi:hypothetical protein